MSTSLEKQKLTEKFYNEKFFRTIYNIVPKYIEIKLDRPDFYFQANNQNFAVELTTYFMQDDEKKNVILKRNVLKYLENENWLYEAHKHLGKTPREIVTIHYKNKQDIINDIIKAKDHITQIIVGNNFWYSSLEDKTNYCILANSKQDTLSIEEFLDYTNFLESSENDISIELSTKNKYNFSVLLRHYIYTLNKKDKCIDFIYAYWNSEEIYCASIEKAIRRKLNKYDEYKQELSNKNLPVNKYVLIIYYEQFALNIENYSNLYYYLKSNIIDFKYDEIGIFFSDKIFVMNKNNYKAYDK